MARRFLHARLLVPLCICGAANQLRGQATYSSPPGTALESTIPRLPILRNVDEAEHEGASFPSQPEPDSLRQLFLNPYSGTAERKCVRPDPIAIALRAGDFAIGAALNRLVARKADKIWMVPSHDPAGQRHGLLVRAARLIDDAKPLPEDTVRIVNLSYAYPAARPDPGAFFPSRSFMLPKTGNWLVIATSGSDWGCIIMTVR